MGEQVKRNRLWEGPLRYQLSSLHNIREVGQPLQEKPLLSLSSRNTSCSILHRVIILPSRLLVSVPKLMCSPSTLEFQFDPWVSKGTHKSSGKYTRLIFSKHSIVNVVRVIDAALLTCISVYDRPSNRSSHWSICEGISWQPPKESSYDEKSSLKINNSWTRCCLFFVIPTSRESEEVFIYSLSSPNISMIHFPFFLVPDFESRRCSFRSCLSFERANEEQHSEFISSIEFGQSFKITRKS